MAFEEAELAEVLHPEFPKEAPRGHWWQSRWTRVLGQMAAVGVIAAPVFATAKLFEEPTATHIGPFDADVELTTDGRATYDFSLIGSVSKPVRQPAGIGFHVTFQDIPIKPTEVNQPTMSDAELQSIAQSFSDTEKVKADVIDSLKDKFLDDLLVYGVEAAALYGGVYLLIGEARRKELSQHAKDHWRLLTSVGLAGGLLAGSVAAPAVAVAQEGSPVSASFDHTPLEGGTIHGRLLQTLINRFGVQGMEYWQDNETFYKEVATELDRQYTDNLTPVLTAQKGTTTILTDEGLKCNVGMATVYDTVARLTGAQLLVSAGDVAAGPDMVENQCVDSLAFHTRQLERVIAPGNHDSVDAQAELERRGFSVLNGQVIEKSGLRIIGDDDPNTSIFGLPKQPRRPETTTQMGHRLSTTACGDNQGVDIYVVNEPHAAAEAVRRGCARLVIAGTTDNIGVTQNRSANGLMTPLDLLGSSGGAVDGEPTFGPLRGPAHLQIIQVDHATKQMFYQQLTINPDKSVVLGPISSFEGAPLSPLP